MGQRSQIYVRIKSDEQIGVSARYFQWNYGERMVSRARGTIEHIIDYLHGNFSGDEIDAYLRYGGFRKLPRFIETNFDMKDIAISSDILEECNEYGEDDIFAQDNNDGQLYIDVSEDGIKYAFVGSDFSTPLDGNAYMNWNCYIEEEGVTSWMDMFDRSKFHEIEEIKYTLDNIEYIRNHATLMTEDEVAEFQDFDYTPFIKETSHIIEIEVENE